MPQPAISRPGIFLFRQSALNGAAGEMHQTRDGVTRTEVRDIDIHGNPVVHLSP